MEDETKQFVRWQRQDQTPERLLENFAARLHLSRYDEAVIKQLFRYDRYLREQHDSHCDVASNTHHTGNNGMGPDEPQTGGTNSQEASRDAECGRAKTVRNPPTPFS